jgi:hypothetical protein
MIHNLARKIVFFTIFSLFLALPTLAQEQTNVNAGFVSGIWYSKDPFFAGEDVRIYTAIQNQSGFDITGKIQFFDNDEMISENSFSSISGQLIQEWTDWKVTEGDHEIYVKLSDTKKSEAGSEPEKIEIIFPSSSVDKKFADIDTDGDGIGNKDDEDDDNDNLSDEKEKEIGTDPLNIDTDNDGHEDGYEFKNGLDPLIHIKDETIQKQVEDEEKEDKDTQESFAKKVIINPATKIKEASEEKADKFTKFIIAKLEKKKVDLKEKIQELKSEKNGMISSTDAQDKEELSEEEKKSINRKITISQVYLSIVSTIIEILKNKWLFIIVVILLILIFIKIFKRKKYE